MENCVAMKDARDNLSDLVSRVAYGKERVSLTKNNKTVAGLVPVEDIEFLESIEDCYDLKRIELALDKLDDNELIAWEDLVKEVGL